MKILYVITGLEYSSEENMRGGPSAHIGGVVTALRNKGHKVIICSYARRPFKSSEIERRILKHRDLKIPVVNEIYRYCALSKQYLDIVKETRPDMVYIRPAPNLFWGMLFRKRDYKLVVECNTPLSLFFAEDILIANSVIRFITKYMDRQICKNADVISAVSKVVKDFLISNISPSISSKIIINPNGVDCDIFRPEGCNYRRDYGISKNDIVIGFSGCFSSWHGIEVLIKAFQALEQKGCRNLRLFIVGPALDKSYADKIKSLASKSGSDNIIFTGYIPFNKMPGYLRTCDILVSPQMPTIGRKFHQSPIKLFEYMAAGRATIASNISQLKDVIKHGYNGLLFEYGNSGDLAEKIRLLAENASLRKQVSENARSEAVGKHSWEKNVNRFLEAI